MEVSGINNKYGGYINYPNSKELKDGNDFMGEMSAESKKTEKQGDGNILGLTMIKEPGTECFWEMTAKYAPFRLRAYLPPR